MAYILTLLLALIGSSPQSAQQETRGGLDPWGTPTVTADGRGQLSPDGGTTSSGTVETDCRGGLDPWGVCTDGN